MVIYIPKASQFYFKENGIKDKKKAKVGEIISQVYYDKGRWKKVEELYIQVVETYKRVLSKEHSSTLTSIANLVLIYKN